MAKKTEQTFIEKYGWKTIAGTVLLTAGQAVDAYYPDYSHVGQLAMMIGTALGGIGLIAKFNKIETKECKK